MPENIAIETCFIFWSAQLFLDLFIRPLSPRFAFSHVYIKRFHWRILNWTRISLIPGLRACYQNIQLRPPSRDVKKCSGGLPVLLWANQNMQIKFQNIQWIVDTHIPSSATLTHIELWLFVFLIISQICKWDICYAPSLRLRG